jgi:hypothetical protein
VKELTLLFFSPFSTRCFSHDFLTVSLIFRTVSGIGFIYSVHPCLAETLSGSNYFVVFLILYFTLFVILRQKRDVFFDLDRDCIVNQLSIFVPE